MKTIECSVVVDANRKAVLQFPLEITPGEHQLVVMVEEQSASAVTDPLQGLPTVSGGSWLQGLSLRREDMYGDDGR